MTITPPVSHVGTRLRLTDKKAHVFALEREHHKVVRQTAGMERGKKKEKESRKFGIKGYDTSVGRTSFVSLA